MACKWLEGGFGALLAGVKSEDRNPRSEGSPKSEIRPPQAASPSEAAPFGLRVSDFLRISARGFRIWPGLGGPLQRHPHTKLLYFSARLRYLPPLRNAFICVTTTLFSELGLSSEVLKAIDKLGFEQAAPIQAAAIPVLMQGKDVVGTIADRLRQDRRLWRAGH